MERRIFAKNARIDGKWQKNKSILIRDGIIASIDDSGLGEKYEYASAGLIDNHIHGSFGFSVTNATTPKMREWLVNMAKAGICGVTCCTYGDINTVRNALSVAKNVIDMQKNGECGGAVMLGAHLEGPFINRNKCGSMIEDTLRTPSIDGFCNYIGGFEDIVIEVTLAPEIDENFELIKYLERNNIRVLLGHTCADYETALKAFAAGAGATCHTFNAMMPMLHRAPGLVTAALTSADIYCEMICDLVHLHEGTVKLIHTCKGAERSIIIADSVETTGLCDGIYNIDGVDVYVKSGESRLADGTLYGGGCLISESVRRLYDIGLPPEDILLMASETPAKWLNLNDWEIKCENTARICCFDGELRLSATYLRDELYN